MLPVAILAGGLATRLAPDHADDPQVYGRGGGRTLRGAPAASVEARGRRARRLLHRPPRRADPRLRRHGRALRARGRLQLRRRRTARHRRGLCAPRCRSSGMPSSCSTATATSTSATPRSRPPSTAAGQPALMTVLRNEDRWDTSNVEFADGRLLRYSKRDRDRACAHRLWPRRRRGARHRGHAERKFDLAPPSTSLWPGRDAWRGSRRRFASTRSVHTAAFGRPPII